ncbi:Appressiria-specific vitulence factor [Podosphaera aphanis]|nr:Appressiria-specific vitulence factor [Podosphaera aphanis]
MHYSSAILIAAFSVNNVFAHGVIDSIQGANDVTMPGLSVADGTPRDCALPTCGSEADTSIIRDRELGTSRASALGRTVGSGPVDASKMVSMFMDGGGNATATKAAREIHATNLLRRSLAKREANGGARTPKGTVEAGVKAAAGMGSEAGMPTCTDDGKIKMTFHQINQDGAGPLSAMIDSTSGGTDPKAFQKAEVTQNVPGLGIGGLSTAAVMDFPVEVQMPAGMTCSGSVGGASDVCVVMLRNQAAAGPFGGSAAYTQSPAAKKRAIEYNLSKRRFARALIKKTQEDDAAAAAIAELEKMGSATTADAELNAEDEKKRDLTKQAQQNSPATGEEEEDEDEDEDEEEKRDVAPNSQEQEAAAAAIAELEKMGSATTADAELNAEDEEKRDLTKQAQQNSSATGEEEEDEDEDEDEEEKRDVAPNSQEQEAAAAAIAELEKMGSATTADAELNAEDEEKRDLTKQAQQNSSATDEAEEDEDEDEEEEEKRDVVPNSQEQEAAAAIAALEAMGSAHTTDA